MKPSPTETIITGRWLQVSSRVVADDNAKRIDELVESHLRRLGADSSGWDTLYRDPDDGRLWELIYPQSGMQGGGPPQLQVVDAATAQAKYGISI